MRTTIKIMICALIMSGFTACFPVMMTHGNYDRDGRYWSYNNQRYYSDRDYRNARRNYEHKNKHEGRGNDDRRDNDNRNSHDGR